MPLPPQTRLGRYTIRSHIAAGGMGEVYLAWDNELHRAVALKLLSSEVASDQQRMNRFIQEARSASALNHPNIITIYEIGKVDGTHFIVMEFIDGVTLRQQTAAARLDINEVLDVAVQIASALTAAHQAGIIHRDIKPENVMVRRDSLVKVLDFGLAKLTNKTAERGMVSSGAETKMRINTNPGMVMGTVSYMSPEQARGLEIDARTDIFSLGVMLYEMVAGRLPFEGVTPNHIIVSIMEKEPPPVTRYRPEVPAELERIISKALQKKRDERYQGVRDMEIDLKRLKQRLEFEAELERTLTPEESREKMAASAGVMDVSVEPRGGTAFSEAVSHPSHPSRPNNLTGELSPLIGREQEIIAVGELLRREEVRLATLTGIGGTGKTRLAQSVARELLGEFEDGVFFIDLATTSDPALVPMAVAKPLGVQESGGKPLIDALREYLRERQMLIVLDNFEQVTSAVTLVRELLSTAPRLKVLVTSREQLHLSAEHVFGVPPLALPAEGRLPPADELLDYAAVALFVERARAARPSFALSGENARAVVDICTRLDGLPLAIELAAARVKVLQPQAILARLENRLKLLTGGARDLPARQQTMRGTISWSYDLLDAGERRLLNRIAVFAGGATLEAAEAVCNAGGDLGVEVLDGVISLVDKSLLMQKEQEDGEPRFRLPEIVREYALEQLESSGEADEIRRRHALYFLSLVEEAEPELRGPRQAEWFDRLEEEHDNLRAALRWMIEHDADSGLRMAGVVSRFWGVHGHLTEGRRWLEATLEKASRLATSARAKALVGAGDLAWSMGDSEAAQKFDEEGLEVSREAGEKQLAAAALNGLGIAAHMQDDLVQARFYFEECLKIGREIGDMRMTSIALGNLAEAARAQNDLATARPLYEEGLALIRQHGDKQHMTVMLVNLGTLAYAEGDYESSRRYYTESLTFAQELDDKRIIVGGLDGFGALAARRGEWERAARLAGAAAALRESTGFELETADRSFHDKYVAEVRATLGDEAFARNYTAGQSLRLKEAIALARE